MITKYRNIDVLIDDPQGRFVEDKEIDVRIKYNSKENLFEVTVPEKKEKELDTTPKKKAEEVYVDSVAKVKGTITVKDHLKVGIDLAIDKALEMGHDRLEDSLLRALDQTYNRCEEHAHGK